MLEKGRVTLGPSLLVLRTCTQKTGPIDQLLPLVLCKIQLEVLPKYSLLRLYSYLQHHPHNNLYYFLSFILRHPGSSARH